MILFFIISILISLALIFLNIAISFKKKNEREKNSPFECGFDPKSFSRIPFSIHFYLLALIFLIFDVEITMIIPMPVIYELMDFKYWIVLVTLFIFILIFGTIYEWVDGSLNWVK